MSIVTEELVQVVATPEIELELETEINAGEDPEKLYTVEEFLALEWDDDDDEEYELIQGRIVPRREKIGPSGKHSRISTKIAYYLEAYAGLGAGEQQLGEVYTEGPCNLGRPKGSSYVVPDVCFVAAGRTPANFSGPIPVAPDLVVEINSPSDTLENIHTKIESYLAAGVGLIWSVYLLDKYVIMYRLGESRRLFLELEDELDGSTVIPGFKLKLNALFD